LASKNELRHLHLAAPRLTRSVFRELPAEYEKALARRGCP
jgi:hypothetical protein